MVYRIVVGLLGVAITVGGLVLVPLPGPGWLIVLAGLALLATEFEPARRLLVFVRRQLSAWTAWLARQGLAARAGVALATVMLIALALYAAAVALGVPGWVPHWLVPPLPGLD
ncbi:MAG TPA: TIGR02611 family protein [Kineosporiaceae bacterium]|nr:TIGR02611 family protein [Kineosporiaceae bacterium]